MSIGPRREIKAAFILDFEERYAIDGILLGKTITIKNDTNNRISIIIPQIIRREGFDLAGIPDALANYGIDKCEWGKINDYEGIEKQETADVWLNSVLIICKARNEDLLIGSHGLEAEGKKVLKALQIIAPKAIRITNDNVPNVLCKVKYSSIVDDQGKVHPAEIVSSLVDDSEGYISFADIKTAIRNSEKTISAPFEMLYNARVNLSHHDFRASVLNCATSIEVMLKKQVASYCAGNNVPKELKEYLEKQADGYTKLIRLCRMLKIDVGDENSIRRNVMDVRNRVIHGGFIPSWREATDAYENTRTELLRLKIPMFE